MAKARELLSQLMHNYTLSKGNGIYGYQQAISESEREQGQATAPLVMIRYLGVIDGRYTFMELDASGSVRYSCKAPCDFVDATAYSMGYAGPLQVIPTAPGSILAAVVEDARNGRLKPMAQPGQSAPVQASVPAAASSTVEAAPPVAQIPVPSASPPAIPAGPSFDCVKAVHPDTQAICASPSLSALDRKLAAVYARARDLATDKQAFRAAQNAAIIQRRLCRSDTSCIAAWYRQRMQQLEAQLSPAGGASRTPIRYGPGN